ncbi:hypothetical protein A9K75_09890 [Campylobacter fetus subsp. testudinum]|nr:hypothetical protein A9K75_09890 [Campylobacter fetus subsp. testudinum]
MRVLLIDNYDSFTYNIVYYLKELGVKVKVVKNDFATTKKAIKYAINLIKSLFHLDLERLMILVFALIL